jgi:hypothetical protein
MRRALGAFAHFLNLAFSSSGQFAERRHPTGTDSVIWADAEDVA